MYTVLYMNVYSSIHIQYHSCRLDLQHFIPAKAAVIKDTKSTHLPAVSLWLPLAGSCFCSARGKKGRETHTHVQHMHTHMYNTHVQHMHNTCTTHAHTYTHMYTHMHTHIYTCTHMYTHMHTHMYTQTHTHAQTHTHKHTRKYTHKHIHTHTNANTNIHT